MLYILDPSEKVVAVLSNDSPQTCPYYNDIHDEKLTDFDSTYEFDCPMLNDDAEKVVAWNFVVREDMDGDLLFFKIITVEDILDGGMYYKHAICENAAITDLMGTIIRPCTLSGYLADDAITYLLEGTGWQVGNVEIIDAETLTFSDYETALAALHTLCDTYGGELKFRVEMSGGRITGKYIDFVEQRGSVTGKRFEYKKDITGLKRTTDVTNLATAIIAVGKEDDNGQAMDITSVNNGLDYVFDDDANEQFNPDSTKYIYGVYQNTDAQTPQELMRLTKEELDKRKKPAYTYEVDVLLLESIAGLEHEAVRLGDTVDIVDFTMQPEITISARIMELQRSYTDSTQDKATLGDFVQLTNITPNIISELQSKLSATAQKADRAATVYRGTTAPEDLTQLWMDTTNPDLYVLKKYDPGHGKWIPMTPTEASQVGAYSVDETDAKINNIQVGGTNLAINTDFSQPLNSSYWVARGQNSMAIDSTNKYNNVNSLKLTAPVAGVSGTTDFAFWTTEAITAVGQQYTFSFYAKSQNGSKITVKTGSIAQSDAIQISQATTTSWTKMSVTLTITSLTPQNSTLACVFWTDKADTVWIALPKLEEGNKATDWTPAPEDIQSQIDATNSQLSDMSSDNKLTPVEKKSVLKDWTAIQAEKSTIDAQADTCGISRTDYDNKYNTLNSYITPILSDMTTTSSITGSTLRTNFSNYYTARTALQKLISDYAKSHAESVASTAQTNAQGYADNTYGGTKTTVTNNSATWNRASNINSDGTFNTSKLNGSIADAQLSSASTWNGIKDVVNSWKGASSGGTVYIDGGLLEADTVTAKQIAIGDFTNLATIDEINGITVNNSWTTSTISGGYNISNSTSFFMFCDQRSPIPFRSGETLYFEFSAVATTAVTTNFGAWVYPNVTGSTGSKNTISNSFTIGTTESIITGQVTVPSFDKSFKSYVLGLNSNANPSANGIKIRGVKVYRMNSGDLIVGNTITAGHISSLNGLTVKNSGGSTTFAIDGSGNVNVNGKMIISSDSTINGTAASTVVNNASTGASGVSSINSKINNAITTIDTSGITVQDGGFYLKDGTTGVKYNVQPTTNYIDDYGFEALTANSADLGSYTAYNIYKLASIQHDITGTTWNVVGVPYQRYIEYEDIGQHSAIFGRSSLIANSSNYMSNDFTVLVAGNTYTLSAFFRRTEIGTGGIPQMKVSVVKQTDLSAVWSQTYTASAAVPTDYSIVRHAMTFTLPTTYKLGFGPDADPNGYYFRFQVQSSNGNWVEVDGLQIVDGTNPTTFISEDVAMGYRKNFHTDQLTVDTYAQFGGDVNFANHNVQNVNHITLNDPGSNEGIEWLSGNGWKIVECPNDMSNAAGNLQFATGSTRRMTLLTDGSMTVGGDIMKILGWNDHGRITGCTGISMQGVTSDTWVNFYLETGSYSNNGELRVVKHGDDDTYTPVRASNFYTSSLEKYKQDIELMQESGLAIINSADIYNYRLKSEVETGIDNNLKYGMVIGEGRRTPEQLKSPDGEAIDQYDTLSIALKAIQELSTENTGLKNDNAELANRLTQAELAISELRQIIQGMQ